LPFYIYFNPLIREKAIVETTYFCGFLPFFLRKYRENHVIHKKDEAVVKREQQLIPGFCTSLILKAVSG
jgi:hypothetical protein